MNYFTIVAHGEGFDVDTFIKDSNLNIDSHWKLGEQKKQVCVPCEHKTSGIKITLEHSKNTNIYEQYKIAYRYLNANKDDLIFLQKYPNVKYFALGFLYLQKVEPNLIGFSMSLPKPIMKVALEIGIKTTYYVELNREDEH